MGNVSKTIVIGNLGKDPQLFNQDASKSPMCVGTLGVDEYYQKRDANGNALVDPTTGKKIQEKITTWYSFQIFGNRATAFAQYHRKGDQVYFEGTMREKEYNSKLTLYLCYDANGNSILDSDGNHFQAYIQVPRKDMTLRVSDWKFMKSKRDDNAYTQPAVMAAPVAPAPVAPAPVALAPMAPAPVALAPVVPAQPQQFNMPVSTIPQGV